MSSDQVLLEVAGLKKYFRIKTPFLRRTIGHIRAVDDVSLTLSRSETLGLVGESGSGKTTLGRSLLRAIEPTSGTVVYHLDGERVDFTSLSYRQLRDMRGHMQMIFQDPFSSLDPRMSIRDIVSEPLSTRAKGQLVTERVVEMMERVGLDPRYLKRYPHAFSGGQRQRIGIARALATNPEFIVCDEPVSALDVSVRGQILNLLVELQNQLGVSYLFISHDLSVVRHIAHRIAVMYVGKVVEVAETGELYQDPKHPYVEALMSANPVADPRRKVERIILSGEIPNPANPPPGCSFHPRCSYAQELCRQQVPALEEISPGHLVACHFASELDLRGAVR